MSYGRADIESDIDSGLSRAGEPMPVSAAVAAARFWFALFVVGVLLRIFLVDVIVNQFWAYTAEGGAFPGKIHPGSYLIFMSAAGLYLTPGFRFAAADLPVLRALLIFCAGALFAATVPMLQGRNGPAGYVLDVYLVTVAAGCFLLAMPPHWRLRLGYIVLGGLCANTLVAIGEFATGRYVLPIEAAEFRPTGFLGAALNVGVIHLSACVYTVSLPIGAIRKYALIGLLMLGLLISASRTAMLVALAVLPLSVLITSYLRKSGFSMGVTAVLMLLFATTAFPLLLMVFSELGFLDRFKSGYVDDSAQTRIEIYRVFEFVSWRDIVMGTDILEIRRIARDMLNIELIESAIVFFVFDFGLIGTILFALLFLWLLWRLARHSHPVVGLGLLVFVGLALTNNTLSTKVPSTFTCLFLAMALAAAHRGGSVRS